MGNSNGKKNILVTGGAGFIGSNLVGSLLQDERVGIVRVIDNLSNGHYKNIIEYISNPRFEFVEGDITDYNTCEEVCENMHLVSHQAALGSVPRSIKDPITSNRVNVGGTLNIFTAVKNSRSIERIVFAASSSTYGDSPALPKLEDNIGKPLSPYAITKYVNELYADVFSKCYENFEYVGLRYFNVFGPKQDPSGAYAAVIPLFFKAALENRSQNIFGDGTNSRDFTYVDNAVKANVLAMFSSNTEAVNTVYNIACGKRTSLSELWKYVCDIANKDLPHLFGKERPGDIAHSHADISKAERNLEYDDLVQVYDGLVKSFKWYADEQIVEDNSFQT